MFMSDHREGRFFGNQRARDEFDAYLHGETPTYEQIQQELNEEERIERVIEDQIDHHERLFGQIDFRDLLDLNTEFDQLLTEMQETRRAIQRLKDPTMRARFQKMNDDSIFELSLDRYAPLRSRVRAKLLMKIRDLYEQAFSGAVEKNLDIATVSQNLSSVKRAIDTGGFSESAKEELDSEFSDISWRMKRLLKYPDYAPLKQQLVNLNSDIRALFDRASDGLREERGARPRLEDPIYLQARRDRVRTIGAQLDEMQQAVKDAFPDKDHHGPGWELRSDISNAQYLLKQAESEIDLSRWIPRAEAILKDLFRRHEDGETIQSDELIRFKTLLRRIDRMHFFSGDHLERGARRLAEELQELQLDIESMMTRQERRLLQEESQFSGRIWERFSEEKRYYWAYRELGLDPEDAKNHDTNKVRDAYRKLVFRYHSDRLPQNLDPNKQKEFHQRYLRVLDAYSALQQAGLLNNDVSPKEAKHD